MPDGPICFNREDARYSEGRRSADKFDYFERAADLAASAHEAATCKARRPKEIASSINCHRFCSRSRSYSDWISSSIPYGPLAAVIVAGYRHLHDPRGLGERMTTPLATARDAGNIQRCESDVYGLQNRPAPIYFT
jgi:hypothetical protein